MEKKNAANTDSENPTLNDADCEIEMEKKNAANADCENDMIHKLWQESRVNDMTMCLTRCSYC